MKIRDYITQRFGTLGVQLSEADLMDIVGSLSIDAEYQPTIHKKAVSLGIINFIPTLLALPNIGESGISLSWNIEGIKAYYDYLTLQYNVNIPITKQPKIKIL